MREIKFRIWWKNPFGKHEFVGSHSQGINFDLSSGQIYCNGINVTTYFELQEFTGIKDIDGKNIYEGDIVRCWGGEYCQGYWEYDVIELVKDIRWSESLYSGENFKIIGNIYENPELLETK